MKKKWLIGGAVVVLALGAGGAWFGGFLQPKAQASSSMQAGKGGKPDVPLESLRYSCRGDWPVRGRFHEEDRVWRRRQYYAVGEGC